MLLWSGDRCCTRTKAIPGSGSAGMPEKKASNAASPPADAPMPTTGHPGASCPDGGSAALGSRISSGSFALRLLVATMTCSLSLLLYHLACTEHVDRAQAPPNHVATGELDLSAGCGS